MNDMTTDELRLNGNDQTLDGKLALKALNRIPFSMTLTDPNLDDNPLVYVNDAFEKVTGYSAAVAVGRNCRFLQNGDNDQKPLKKLRKAIEAGEACSVTLKNYRADGDMFRNRLMIAPLRHEDGSIEYFLGIQMRMDAEEEDETKEEELDQKLSELQHRVKNHLSMVIGMIRLQSRKSDAKEQFSTLARRIEALQLLYEELSDPGKSQGSNQENLALGAYLSRVANAVAHIGGKRGVRVNIDADAIRVPFEPATRLGLIVSEVLTNSLQHAFEDRDSGLLEVRVKSLSGGVLRVHMSDDGSGLPEDIDWPNEGSLGGRLVKELARGLEAKLSVIRELNGTVVILDVPHKVLDIS